jgi:hypothetical protein
MPLYEFVGVETGRSFEMICSYKDRPEKMFDPDTGEEFRLKLTAPNFSKSNLNSWADGLSHKTYYDPKLGQTIFGEAHKEQVLKARGLVRESDLPKGFIEAKMENTIRAQEEADKQSDQFVERLKHYGLDKQGEDTGARIKATEAFWSEQVPLGDLCNNPTKYGVQPKEN